MKPDNVALANEAFGCFAIAVFVVGGLFLALAIPAWIYLEAHRPAQSTESPHEAR